MPKSDQLKKLSLALRSSLDEIDPKIDDILKNGLLSAIAAEFRSAGLITQPTKDEPSYQKISRELKNRMLFLNTQEELEGHCYKIVIVLQSKGGPLVDAAKELEDSWTEKASQLHITFTVGSLRSVQETDTKSTSYVSKLETLPQISHKRNAALQHLEQSQMQLLCDMVCSQLKNDQHPQSLQNIFNKVRQVDHNSDEFDYAEGSEETSKAKGGASIVGLEDHKPQVASDLDYMERPIYTPRYKEHQTEAYSNFVYGDDVIKHVPTAQPVSDGHGNKDATQLQEDISLPAKSRESHIVQKQCPKRRGSNTSVQSAFSHKSNSVADMEAVQEEGDQEMVLPSSRISDVILDIQKRLSNLEKIQPLSERLHEKDVQIMKLETSLNKKEIQLEERERWLRQMKEDKEEQLKGKDTHLQAIEARLNTCKKENNAQIQALKNEKNNLVTELNEVKENYLQEIKKHENRITLTKIDILLVICIVFLAMLCFKLGL